MTTCFCNVWLVHLYGDYFWGSCLIALLENGDLNKVMWLFWWLHWISTLELLPAGNETTMKCLVWNVDTEIHSLFSVSFTRILSLINHTAHKQAHLIVSKHITTSAFGNNAYKYTWKHLCVDTYKQKAALCAQSHTVRHIEHTHTYTHKLAHTLAHTHEHTHTLLVCSFCQLSPSACRLCVWHRG